MEPVIRKDFIPVAIKAQTGTNSASLIRLWQTGFYNKLHLAKNRILPWSTERKMSIISGLESFPHPECEETLITLLTDRDVTVQQAAKVLLKKWRENWSELVSPRPFIGA